MKNNQKIWYAYIVKCSDGSFYTGITTDLTRRIHEHNNTNRGAKYTRGRRPVVLMYSSKFETRSEASKLEYMIKNMERNQKIQFLKNEKNNYSSKNKKQKGFSS